MNTCRFLLALAVCVFFVENVARAQKSGDADSQLWSETRLVYKLNDKFDIFTAGSYRLTKDFSDFNRVSARFGGSWAATDRFTVTPSYFYTVGNPWTSAPNPENRACLLLTYRMPIWGDFTLTPGITTEYRMPQNAQDAFWLRPRIKLSHAVGPKTWGLDAFVADELFYNHGKDICTQDQAFAGFEKKFNDTFTTSLYYCRRTKMNATFLDANAICIDFKITFGSKSSTPPEPQFR